MNKYRKQNILIIRNDLRRCKDNLQNILDEEQMYFDNMPENLQGSLRGMESEDSIDVMENSIEILEKIIDDLLNI